MWEHCACNAVCHCSTRRVTGVLYWVSAAGKLHLLIVMKISSPADPEQGPQCTVTQTGTLNRGRSLKQLHVLCHWVLSLFPCSFSPEGWQRLRVRVTELHHGRDAQGSPRPHPPLQKAFENLSGSEKDIWSFKIPIGNSDPSRISQLKTAKYGSWLNSWTLSFL